MLIFHSQVTNAVFFHKVALVQKLTVNFVVRVRKQNLMIAAVCITSTITVLVVTSKADNPLHLRVLKEWDVIVQQLKAENELVHAADCCMIQ